MPELEVLDDQEAVILATDALETLTVPTGFVPPVRVQCSDSIAALTAGADVRKAANALTELVPPVQVDGPDSVAGPSTTIPLPPPPVEDLEALQDPREGSRRRHHIAVSSLVASFGIGSTAWKLATGQAWGHELVASVVLAGLMSALLALHGLLQICTRWLGLRHQLAAVGVLVCYLAVTAGAIGISAALAGRFYLPTGVPELGAIVLFVVWYTALTMLRSVKPTIGLNQFFDDGTPGGILLRHVRLAFGWSSDWIFGTGDKEAVLPVPLAILLVGSLLSAVSLFQQLGGKAPSGKPEHQETAVSIPSQVALSVPYPATLQPIGGTCHDDSNTDAAFAAVGNRALASAMLTAWRHDGTALLGCPESAAGRVGDNWVVPLSGGQLHPAFVVGNEISGTATVVRKDAGALAWGALQKGGIATIYPEQTLTVGTWQFLDTDSGSCELIRGDYGETLSILVPAAVLAVISIDAQRWNALFTIYKGERAGTYDVTFYAGPYWRERVGTALTITYVENKATAGALTSEDGKGCSAAARALMERGSEASQH